MLGGEFVAKLMLSGYLVEGIEPCIPLVESIRKKGVGNIYIGKLEEYSFKRKYDLVYLRGTMMYLLDISRNLEIVTGLVKDNGYLVVVETNPDCQISMQDFRNPLYLNGLSYNFMRKVQVKYNFSVLKTYLYEEDELIFYDIEKYHELLNKKAKVVYILKK